MKNVFESASKIVFILIAVTVCAAFIIGLLPVEQFMYIATSVFAFYFSNKGNSDEKYLGK